jgi:predicted HicB family RNase H-like nuclease
MSIKGRNVTTFNMRIDRKLKAEAEKAAASDNRSLAGLIVKLLRDHLAKTKPGRRT